MVAAVRLLCKLSENWGYRHIPAQDALFNQTRFFVPLSLSVQTDGGGQPPQKKKQSSPQWSRAEDRHEGASHQQTLLLLPPGSH